MEYWIKYWKKYSFLSHFSRFFVTLPLRGELTQHSAKKKKYVSFVLPSFFRNFAPSKKCEVS